MSWFDIPFSAAISQPLSVGANSLLKKTHDEIASIHSEGRITRLQLSETTGFEMRYLDSCVDELVEKKLLKENGGYIKLTMAGRIRCVRPTVINLKSGTPHRPDGTA